MLDLEFEIASFVRQMCLISKEPKHLENIF